MSGPKELRIKSKTVARLSASTENIDVIVSRQKHFKVQAAIIKKISTAILDQMGLSSWELCVKFVGKEEIKDLNKQYRSKDYATDVLSFPQAEWKEPLRVGERGGSKKADSDIPVLGDIVICLDIALENAEKIGQSIDREVCFLLVHGVLHLCGHDHEVEEEELLMLEDQRKIMESFSADLPVWKDCVRILENN